MSLLYRIAENRAIIPDIIEEYEALISEEVVAKELQFKGKVLEHVAREHASKTFYYMSRKAEIHAVVKWQEGRLNATRGKHWKQFTEHYSRELNDRTKDKYIDNEKDVLTELQIYLTFKELHEKYDAVCEAFKSQGFMIRHITELRIRSLEDSTID